MAKFCVNCGAKLIENSNFCVSCGKKINESFSINNPVEFSKKSKLIAGLLGIFLGALGIHNFYLDYKGKAIAQLLITLLSCGALVMFTSVWGLIEGIMILTDTITKDGHGNKLES